MTAQPFRLAPGLAIDRRSLFGLSAALALRRRAQAQTSTETIALWPKQPPNGQNPQGPERIDRKGRVTHVVQPRLSVYRPAEAGDTAALVISGGGYAHIEAGTESTPACQWLRSAGITTFELFYRLPDDGWGPEAPFQDGQRAMRLMRSKAAGYGINPAKIGVLGFSAGGHLAGMTAVQPEKPLYPAIDAVDSLSARPDFAALLYPVLTMMPPFDHTHARREILGPHPTLAESEAYSVERQVTPNSPPMFLAQAADDPISPVDNSLMMFQALRSARVAAELHIFETGGHGWGLGQPGTAAHAWPDLFLKWLEQNQLSAARP